MTEFYKDKKILICGGAGFIGTNLIKRLLELGAKDVRATIHSNKPRIKDRAIKYISCELTNKKDCLKATKGIDLVFMAAANTSGAAVMEKTPLVHVTPNVIMNTLMLESSYEQNVKKFLFISSNTVYPDVDHPVKEDEMLKGELFEKYFCVGWMKRFSEVLCQMYSTKIKKPLNTVVVRPANAYGEFDKFDPEKSHVIPALIRKVVARNNPLEVWGDGSEIKDFIYIGDLIDGMLLAMEKLESYEPLNIASGKPISVKESLGIILKVDGFTDAKIVYNTSKPTMILRRLIDASKARQLLGFQAKVSFEDGIRNTLNWYRKEYKIKRSKK